MKKRVSFILALLLLFGLSACRKSNEMQKIQVDTDLLEDGTAHAIIKDAAKFTNSAKDYTADYEGTYNGEEKSGTITKDRIDNDELLSKGFGLGKMAITELPSSYIVNEKKEWVDGYLEVSCNVDVISANELIVKFAPSYDIGLTTIFIKMVFDSDGYLERVEGNLASEQYNVQGTATEIKYLKA